MLLMKKYKQLTSEQKYAIYLGLENGDTQRTIASLIGVSPSAVSRELQRNKDKRGGYSWRLAHEMAMERRERLPGNRATPEWIKQKVIRLVRKDWSPGQISGHLRKKENIRVSHETIYKWIREASAGGADMALSLLFDLIRDPRFGRVEECYSEDPYLTGVMGSAFVVGMQGDPTVTRHGLPAGKLACTAKHFA